MRSGMTGQFGDFYQLQRNTLYRGKSGVSHEIDLAVEFTVAGLKYLTIFEVKYLGRKLGASDVQVCAAKGQDIGANKIVLVSNTSFSSVARQVAESSSVVLLRVPEHATTIVECFSDTNID